MFQFEVDESAIEDENNRDVMKRKRRLSLELDEEFSIGDCVGCEGNLGMVKFIGVLEGHQGLWLGVDWDEEGRGKHDGSVKGIRYFTAKSSNSASFIRPHKVKKARDILQALDEKYGQDEEFIGTVKQIQDRLENLKINYEKVKVLDVSSTEILTLGKEGELAKKCPNIEFLNVGNNLISSWESFLILCKSFIKLKMVDVSCNPLHDPSNSRSNIVLDKLEHLIAGKLKYDWESFLNISVFFPSITNFQIPFNKIQILKSPTQTLTQVSSLDLEGNEIISWGEVNKLSTLQNLAYLNLCCNKIPSIYFETENPSLKSKLFPKLRKLNLSENSIQDWDSINELDKLENLTELRIDLNPFLNQGESRASNRQTIIARIGNLKKLEGTSIERQERRDSELDYLKKFGHKWTEYELDEIGKGSFVVENPRFLALIKRWGRIEIGEMPKKTKTMKNSLISLEFVSENKNLIDCRKQMLTTMTVQKLKMLIQRIFKQRTIPVELKVISGQNPNVSFFLLNDFFDLAQYSVEDGDKILITW